MSPSLTWLRIRSASAIIASLLAAALLCGCQPGAPGDRPKAAEQTKAAFGVYAGPGPKAVIGARRFSEATGTSVSRVLDFLPQESWRAMTLTDWLLKPYRGSGFQLELSVPMVTSDESTSLAQCAQGRYTEHWKTIALKLKRHHQESATIRPGWEFNGDWYRWSAAGQVGAYVGCFHAMVDAMRAVSPSFTFAWSVNVGVNELSAEQAWPGDGYVDFVGVDVYDYSSRWYPPPEGVSMTSARSSAWDTTLNGSHGLAYWVRFARSHHKPLGLDEWGLAWRSNGQAGGDNTLFVENMMAFIKEPSNRVTYANYFNSPDTSDLRHSVTGSGHRFPRAAERLKELAGQR